MKNRKMLLLTRPADGGEVNVIYTDIPSSPQTLVFRLRPGQQVCLEIEEDNSKSRKKKKVPPQRPDRVAT